ncbi:MAG: OmpA family protein [Planctomycetota bacterium]|nr:OmpA family protein [Planctomycetota bacterium]
MKQWFFGVMVVGIVFFCGCVPWWTYKDVVEGNRNLKQTFEEMKSKFEMMDKEATTARAKAAEYEITNRLLKERISYLEGVTKEAQEELEKLKGGLVQKVQKIELPQDVKGQIFVTEGGAIGVEGEVLFPPGKHSLRPEAKAAVAAVAKILLSPEYKNYYFRIDGHTDDQPIRVSGYESNWHLSVMRALSVLNELKAQGVPEDRMFIGGFGEFKPRVPNEPNKKGHMKNRRVEITILKSK